MRRLAAASASIVMLAPTATLAADLPAPPAYQAPAAVRTIPDWSGPFIGANVGGGTARAHSDFSAAGATFATVDTNLSGAIGGLQAGYNWQSSALVYGLETDFQWSSLKGSISTQCPSSICVPATSASYTQNITWFGTARGRLGYAADGWLAYVTGGYAHARVGFDATATGGGVTATLSPSATRDGWTFGGGIEVAFAPHWSAKLEYLYVDLGSRTNIVAVAGLPAVTDQTRVQMNVMRVGANFRF